MNADAIETLIHLIGSEAAVRKLLRDDQLRALLEQYYRDRLAIYRQCGAKAYVRLLAEQIAEILS